MLTREQYFPGHAPGEDVALFIRRHWMAFFPWMIFGPLILLVILLILALIWLPANSILRTSNEAQVMAVVLTSMALLGVFFALIRAWMSYYLDITIVTERRLVNIDQRGIFVRRISEQSLLRVQDVSARQQGFFHHFLNYGHLFIETAGTQPNFEIHNISRPNDVAKTILDLHDRLVGGGGHEVEEMVAEGSLEPINVEGHPPPHTMSSHPLEGLQSYFPEPGVAHDSRVREREIREITLHPHPAESTEEELHDGETISVRSHRS